MKDLLIRIRSFLESVPYTLLALPLRVGVGAVFWYSGMTKLANWDSALQLFRDGYRVPLLPPELAAHLALAIELSAPVLLVLGLLTRPTAFVLLGMTAVIEVFVYPLAWPTHIQWGGDAPRPALPRAGKAFHRSPDMDQTRLA